MTTKIRINKEIDHPERPPPPQETTSFDGDVK